MRFSVLAVVFAAATAATAAAAPKKGMSVAEAMKAFPSCSYVCIHNADHQGCGRFDFNCLCDPKHVGGFTKSATPCVEKKCGSKVGEVWAAKDKVCKSYGH